MPDKFDIVIVGGRCAGAVLGAFLARDGAKVAIIDADARHSDVVVSTHLLHPAGMDVLKELGVAEAVGKEAPAWIKSRFDIDGGVVDVNRCCLAEKSMPHGVTSWTGSCKLKRFRLASPSWLSSMG